MNEVLDQGISFPLRFGGSGSLVMSSEEAHIRESLIQILMTQPGERVMRPEFGCDLRSLVFEPYSRSLASLAEARVRMAIARWEPRVRVIRVNLTPGESEGVLYLEVEYEVVRTQTRGTLQLTIGGE